MDVTIAPLKKPIWLDPEDLEAIDDLPKSGLYYLGSPYSHPDRLMRVVRFHAVNRVAGILAHSLGLHTFCPIAHSHPISEEIADRVSATDGDFWLSWDEALVPRCDGLIVCALPGWEWSSGLCREVPQFDTICMYNPIDHFTETEWAMLEAWNA